MYRLLAILPYVNYVTDKSALQSIKLLIQPSNHVGNVAKTSFQYILKILHNMSISDELSKQRIRMVLLNMHIPIGSDEGRESSDTSNNTLITIHDIIAQDEMVGFYCNMIGLFDSVGE